MAKPSAPFIRDATDGTEHRHRPKKQVTHLSVDDGHGRTYLVAAFRTIGRRLKEVADNNMDT